MRRHGAYLLWTDAGHGPHGPRQRQQKTVASTRQRRLLPKGTLDAWYQSAVTSPPPGVCKFACERQTDVPGRFAQV
jgi:hypothetical protein